MASVNKAILIGNLGRDPEVRHMPNGDAVANFSIATTESYKDKNGDKQEKTEWHNLVCYGRLGEIAGQYLKKGKPVYIEGRIQTRKWTDKNQVERYTTEIIVQELKMLGGRDSSGSSDDEEHAPDATTQRQASQQGATKSTDDWAGDIPFAPIGRGIAGHAI